MVSNNTKPRSAIKIIAACAISVTTLASFNAFAGGDVRWSVSVGSTYPQNVVVYPAPVVVYPARPVVYPAPVVVYPAPPVVYQQPPQVIYRPAPVVYYSQPPVVYQPQPVFVGPHGHWRHGHGRHPGHGYGYRNDPRVAFNVRVGG